jgi:shikimate kinase
MATAAAGGSGVLDGAAIEDLCLTFVTAEDVPLVAEGGGRSVTRENLRLYVQRLLMVVLREGVEEAATAMREGLAEVIRPETLAIFSEQELAVMWGGEERSCVGP